MKEPFQTNTTSLTIPQSQDAASRRRNPLMRTLKSVLVSASSVLPDSVYKPIYESSFAFYKSLLRQLYFRHVARAWFSGDPIALTRAKSVYRVMPYSLVGSSGLEATFDAASDLIKREIPGSFVECGVAQGGCSALMALIARSDPAGRKIWLFDSFQGLPSPTKEDYDVSGKWTGEHIRPLPRGSCLGMKGQVESLLFGQFGLDRQSVFLIDGWFQDTLPLHKNRISEISLLRIDGDWYESTICCLHHLYDKVSPGGYVIIDDYGVCYGCKKAVHEFLDERGLNPRLVPDGRGGVLFSKSS
jgi:O-methyltransferase